MGSPQSVAEIISGWSTTADKIRALARAGFTRTEIAKELGIQYQHVRTVMLDAGITGGLQRENAAREPISVEAEPPPRELTTSTVLTRAGFLLVGEWQPDVASIRLDGTAPIDPGVYSFVVDDVVMYVGLTANGLKVRLDQYRLGYAGQSTNVRVKGLIMEALAAGHRVQVFAAMPAALDWNGLPVNAAAGLEAGLIQMIRPVWNIAGLP